MNNQESIIVYRNPIERDFWEFWHNNPNTDGYGIVLLVSCVLAVGIYALVVKKKKRY